MKIAVITNPELGWDCIIRTSLITEDWQADLALLNEIYECDSENIIEQGDATDKEWIEMNKELINEEKDSNYIVFIRDIDDNFVFNDISKT